MNTPSTTVQAAQQLLADREVVGLAKYGTTVDRTDLQAGDWLQHAIEEASDLLLYLIRMQQDMRTAARCECGDRPSIDCPGAWEPGCDLGANEAHAVTAHAAAAEKLIAEREAMGARFPPPNCRQRLAAEGKAYPRSSCAVCGQFSPKWKECGAAIAAQKQPAPAEDPERAAYLRRWEGAPAHATHLAEDEDGECFWHSSQPRDISGGVWHGGLLSRAGEDILGSVRCEPRPGVEG